MKQLIEVIKDQAVFNFTGRINIVNSHSGQYLGHLLMQDGKLYDAWSSQKCGKRALYQLGLIVGNSNTEYKCVIEPEIVDTENVINIKIDSLEKEITDFLEQYQKVEHLTPPKDLRLKVNPEFINQMENISAEEFTIIKTIIEFPVVDDIYQKCNLLHHEITLNIINLRKRKAILVTN